MELGFWLRHAGKVCGPGIEYTAEVLLNILALE